MEPEWTWIDLNESWIDLNGEPVRQSSLHCIEDEYGQFLNWKTELIKTQPSNQEDIVNYVGNVEEWSKELKILISSFKENLKNHCNERDISEDKL